MNEQRAQKLMIQFPEINHRHDLDNNKVMDNFLNLLNTTFMCGCTFMPMNGPNSTLILFVDMSLMSTVELDIKPFDLATINSLSKSHGIFQDFQHFLEDLISYFEKEISIMTNISHIWKFQFCARYLPGVTLDLQFDTSSIDTMKKLYLSFLDKFPHLLV